MITQPERNDEQKEFISTVVPLRDAPLYLGSGYFSEGCPYLDAGVEMVIIKKRIAIKEGDN